MKDELILHPPVTHSRRALMQWMCELHNEVNDRMGKQTFDCSKYEERWRTGPADGSCGTRKKKAAAPASAAASQ
jgi:FAD-linked sulfhydryl oxidase